jgi:hypothetical protein
VYLNAMLEMYGVTDPAQRQVLIDMAREGHRKGWWSVYDDVLPTGFGIYVGLEAEAAGVRSFEAEVVHGLFQTPEYAYAVLREVNSRDTDEQIKRLVDLRMKRQEMVDRDPPFDVWLILDEAVIRRTIGGPTVMRDQLARLMDASKLPNVTLQVLPFDSGSHAGLKGPFSILEFPERADADVAYVESLAGIIYLEKDREVRTCAEAFDRLRATALSPGASADLISKAADDLVLPPAGDRTGDASSSQGLALPDSKARMIRSTPEGDGWKPTSQDCTGSRAVRAALAGAWR